MNASFYHLCQACGAKWFARSSLALCPRCGAESRSREQQAPPWQRSARGASDDRFHYAVEYWERGWSVLPLRGLQPAFANWRKLSTKRRSLESLRRWVRADSAYNVGIMTGTASGLIALGWNESIACPAWPVLLPKTPLVIRDGKRGVIAVYRAPFDERIPSQTVKSNGARVSVIGEESFFPAPPFKLPDGRNWRWEQEGDYSLDAIPVFDPARLGGVSTRWADDLPQKNLPHRRGGVAVEGGQSLPT